MSVTNNIRNFNHYINAKSVRPYTGEYFYTVDPYTGEPWAQIASGSSKDLDLAVRAAKEAFRAATWSKMTATERGGLLRNLGDLVLEHANELASIEMKDNGKLISEVLPQVKYVAEYFYYFGGLADKIQGDVIPTDKKGVFTYTEYVPKGVVGIITPWNSPLALTAWKLAPALAAGCTAVVKPSEYTSASMIEFARLFERAGFPPGVVNVVCGIGENVGKALVSHPDVAHIGFTGGEKAGQKIYMNAAKTFKTVTLELGGKSPNIVFEDADLERAINGVIAGIFAASGQTCIAGSRLLVQRSIHDEFLLKLKNALKDVIIGDPADPETQIGPIATEEQFDKIMEYIEIAKNEGAVCYHGGSALKITKKGRFVEPTIFTEVTNDMRIAQEEVFGPVLAVISFDDMDDALRIANDSRFGLAAGVWTQSLNVAMSMADALEAGTIWVNNYRSTSFTSPFGGIKGPSGIGRESGINTIYEYLDTKCVWMSSDLHIPNPFVRR